MILALFYELLFTLLLGEQTGLWLGSPLSISCSDKTGPWPPPTPAVGGLDPSPPGQDCAMGRRGWPQWQLPSTPEVSGLGLPTSHHDATQALRCVGHRAVPGFKEAGGSLWAPPCPSGDIKGPARGVAGGQDGRGAACSSISRGSGQGGPAPPWVQPEATHGDPQPPPEVSCLGSLGASLPLGAWAFSQLVTPEAGRRVRRGSHL